MELYILETIRSPLCKILNYEIFYFYDVYLENCCLGIQFQNDVRQASFVPGTDRRGCFKYSQLFELGHGRLPVIGAILSLLLMLYSTLSNTFQLLIPKSGEQCCETAVRSDLKVRPDIHISQGRKNRERHISLRFRRQGPGKLKGLPRSHYHTASCVSFSLFSTSAIVQRSFVKRRRKESFFLLSKMKIEISE